MLPIKMNSRYSKLLTRLISFVMLLALTPSSTSATSTELTVQAQQLVAEADALRATWKENDLREALKKYDNAAETWSLVPDLSSASQVTLQAGDVCFLLSEFAEALKRYDAAERLAETGGNRLAQGRALSKMGRANSYMGNNDLARSQIRKALTLLQVAQDDPNLTAKSAYGEALINMAEVTHSIGNYAKVLDQLKEARTFLDHDREGQARIHLLIGNTVGSLGDAERALWEADRALELYEALNNKAGAALARVPRGMSYAFKGRAEPAIPILDDVASVFRSIGDRYSEAIAMNGLGTAYEKLNNFAVARSSHENALRLSESVGALDTATGALFKLGTLHIQKEPEKALAYFEHCVTLSRSAKLVRTEALALTFIALAYETQNRPAQAAQRHRKAQSYYQEMGDRRGQVIALNLYGNYLFFRLGQTQQALDIFRQALPLSEAVGDTSLILDSRYNLASAHVALGDYEAALPLIDGSLNIIEELRAGVRTPDLRTMYFSGVRQHYELCTHILMQLHLKRPNDGFAERAFLMSEKSRARSLVDLVRESGSAWREGATPDEVRREREIVARIQVMSDYRWTLSLSGQNNSTEASEVTQEMAQLNAEYYKIQAEVRTKTLSKPALAEVELKDVAQVQRMLPADGTMLLEYALGNDASYLWAITFNSFQTYQLPPRNVVEGAARDVYDLLIARQRFDNDGEYQAKVAQADTQLVEKATSLSQMLLGPISSQLGNRRLLVVREGALQLAPFDALPVASSVTGQVYLAETNEVVALPSLSTLLAMRTAENRHGARRRLVAIFADAVFSPTDERVKTGSSTTAQAASLPDAAKGSAPRAPRLIYSSEEADAIIAAAPYGTTMVAKGFDASRETAMSQSVGEYQIVHFATHGFLDTEHPELSAMVLSMVDQNGAHRNGVMPLNEIYNLDLAAELTVLSACQTALGTDIKGEGLIGLTHGFLSAGSKSVVASLWKVDDRATAALMSYFYQAMLQEKLPPSAALRAAKLKMKQDKQWSAPYYWAGFVFQGDYESRINVESNSRLVICLVVLLLVLASSVLLIFLRRRRRSSPAK